MTARVTARVVIAERQRQETPESAVGLAFTRQITAISSLFSSSSSLCFYFSSSLLLLHPSVPRSTSVLALVAHPCPSPSAPRPRHPLIGLCSLLLVCGLSVALSVVCLCAPLWPVSARSLARCRANASTSPFFFLQGRTKANSLAVA